MSALPDPAGSVDDAPVLRVLRGDPTVEQLAALVSVLAAAASSNEPEPPSTPSRWAAPAVRLGRVDPGRGTWRFSGMPR